MTTTPAHENAPDTIWAWEFADEYQSDGIITGGWHGKPDADRPGHREDQYTRTETIPTWQPIDTAPFDAKKPFIVWLPILKVAVSAMPMNVLYADEGNTAIGWDGPPEFTMTDLYGEAYMLNFQESPTLWMSVCIPTQGAAT